MAFQEFELNMIPHGDMPTFYASQYETGRPIIIDVMLGEDAFACDELYIELHCRKVDDNIVTLEPDSVDGNQVTFVGTDQLFACPGKNLCEVCLYADETKDTSLGSLNFFIEVEPDPLAGGLTSETQIYDLYQQVEEITQQVIGDDYYDKDEVDALLDDKADKATTYTKTQVDSALALKANSADLATVATTGDYDDLTNKPTIPAAQVQSDWDQSDNTKVDYIKNKPSLATVATTGDYDDLTNQPDVNAMIATAIYNTFPTKTASGIIVNFSTALTMKVVSCAVDASATTITICGENLFDKATVTSGYLINGSGNQVSYTGWNISDFISVPEGGSLYLNGLTTHPNSNQDNFMLFDENKTKIGYANILTSQYPWVIPAGTKYVKFSLNDIDLNTAQLSPTTGTSGTYVTPVVYPVSEKDNIITLSGINNIFADVGTITVGYKDTTL